MALGVVTAVRFLGLIDRERRTPMKLLAVFDPTDMNADEQAAVWTLIQYLKRKEVADRSNEQRRHNPARTAAAAAASTATKEATMDDP
jgi:hypothetical protein